MSTFKVEVKKISKIYPHPNADRLELGQVDGMTFQFVVQKGLYKEGDEVVYFPIDCLLSQEFIVHQNISNFLSGKDKNRVVTKTLRGQISQGYVCPVQSIKDYLKVDTLPVDLTSALNITKYEPPEVMIHTGRLVRLPEAVYYYDIEGCDRYPDIVAKMMKEVVVISEKVEGSNMAVSSDIDGNISVCQHSYAIINLPDKEKHTFWAIAENEGLVEATLKLQKDKFNGHSVTIRSEALGPKIQSNYYNFNKYTTRIFDIEIDKKAVNFAQFIELLDYVGLKDKCVPIISSGVTLETWLAGKTLQEASHGKSVLIDKLREGIVIKPEIEQFISGFGRFFLKQRDPIYLAGTGA